MGFGKDGKGAILREAVTVAALGTLALNTAIFFTGGIVVTDPFRMLKAICTGAIDGLTGGQAEGLYLGIAQGDQSVAEIAATLTNDGPVAHRSTDVADISEKPTWLFGYFERDAAGTSANLRDFDSGGSAAICKQAWTYGSDIGWNFFIFNTSTALGAGATAKMVVTEYGVWVGA